MYYWNKKDERKAKAEAHAKRMGEQYAEEIEQAVKNTLMFKEVDGNHNRIEVFKDGAKVSEFGKKEWNTDTPSAYLVGKTDSVSAVLSPKWEGKKVCVLNFASFKNPGGMFLNGSSAQEEALCHESFLFNVLSEHDKRYDFYEFNRKNLNKGMYLNRALYTPDVRFVRDGKERLADVITCAAPNYSVALKYGRFTAEENAEALKSRIDFVKEIINQSRADVAVLGAWGCGVFKQDAATVAKLWNADGGVPVDMTAYAIMDEPTYRVFKNTLG